MAEVQFAGGPWTPLSSFGSNGDDDIKSLKKLSSQCTINNTSHSLPFRERVIDLAKQRLPDLSDVRFALSFADTDQKAWFKIIDIARIFWKCTAQPNHVEEKTILETRDRLMKALKESLEKKDAKIAEEALAAL